MKLRRHGNRRGPVGKGASEFAIEVAPEVGAEAARVYRLLAAQLPGSASLRRKRGTRNHRPSAQSSDSEVVLTTDDGTLSFRLKRLDGHVLMERTRRRGRAIAVVQANRFPDEASFTRWCDGDRLRFAYPLLFATLKRIGRALFHRST